MSKCLGIDVLEKTALNKLRGLAIPASVQQHLDECNFCSEQYEELKLQLGLAEQQFSTISESRVEKFANSLTGEPRAKYIFKAELIKMPASRLPQENSFNTRAADSARPARTTRFQNKGVLSTAGDEILVRIISDMQTGDTHLHLIADDEEKISNVPVLIDSLGREYTTDQLGRINLGKAELPSLDQLKLLIQTPRAVFDMSVLQQRWKELIGKGEIVLKNQDNDRLYIEFQPTGVNYRLSVRLDAIQLSGGLQKIQIVANKETDGDQLKNVKQGVAVFQDIAEESIVHVKVFG